MQAKAEKLYDYFLTDIHAIMGNDVTSSTDLHRVGKCLFGSLFSGVYARDTLPRNVTYAIVNTDNSDGAGVHWLAVVKNSLIYDSFGRDMGFNIETTDPDAEQDMAEVNCGQRCLAFLCVYHARGRQYAKLI